MNTEEKEQAQTQCKPQSHHGHAMKRLRRDRGLSQKDLAALIGMSPQALSRYEAQEVVNDDILKQVAKGLNVSIDLIKELEEEKSLAFYVENNTFSGNNATTTMNMSSTDSSTDKSVTYQIDQNQKYLLEEIRKNSEETRLQYENIIAGYKEMVESYKEEIRELRGMISGVKS